MSMMDDFVTNIYYRKNFENRSPFREDTGKSFIAPFCLALLSLIFGKKKWDHAEPNRWVNSTHVHAPSLRRAEICFFSTPVMSVGVEFSHPELWHLSQ